MIVFIDNGHGKETPGKCSPDGRLMEWRYARESADRIVSDLKRQGIDSLRIVPEEQDVSLSERCRRVNNLYRSAGRGNAVLLSIHCNAAGMGDSWMNACGWSAFVSPNASANSRRLAECLYGVAEDMNVNVRRYSPNRNYWIQNLAICRDTNCPAVLVENFFQDNKKDVEFLLSEEGRKCVADIAVKGIINYLRL